jgi:hypothetical protein
VILAGSVVLGQDPQPKDYIDGLDPLAEGSERDRKNLERRVGNR